MNLLLLRSGKSAAWILTLAMCAHRADAQELIRRASSSAPNTVKEFPLRGTDPRPHPIDVAPTTSNDYMIGEGDLLSINVWKEKEISQELPVRPDGKISLPLLGDIQASGLTPVQLQQVIAQRLKTFLQNPQVAIIVKDPRSHQYNVVGQVVRPGSYPLIENMTVLDALAGVGGFQDFAKKTKIYVLRPTPSGARFQIPFNFKQVIVGRNPGQNILLKPGDTIVVP
jgi:polysaccharide export outer membrane protein